jgi:hypothetical protein
MWLAFVVFLVLLSAAIYAGMKGNNILAGLLLASGVISGVIGLIKGNGK